MTSDNPLLRAALLYAEHRFPVFPLWWPRGAGCSCHSGALCSSPAKHPIGTPNGAPHGVKDATTDQDRIAAWWARYPLANVAIATGGPLNLVVLDVDGEEGLISLKALEEEFGPIPETVRAWTGSGGQHIYFQGPPPDHSGNGSIRNKAGVKGYKGLDLRAEGGYVVAPPSRHVSGKCYRWWAKECELVELPRAFLPAFSADAPTAPRPALSPAPPPTPSPDNTPYGLGALRAETDRVANTPQGSRNDALNAASFKLSQLVAGGQLTEDCAVQALTDAGHAAGLSALEIAKTIRSGMDAGQATPRAPAPMEPPARHTNAPPAPTTPKPAKHTNALTPPPSPGLVSPTVPLYPSILLGELLDADIPPPVELVADRALVAGTVNMIHGTSGSGKTLHVMGMVEALATGSPWLGRAVSRPLKVLWLSAEGGRILLRDRLDRFKIDPAARNQVRVVTFEEVGGVPGAVVQAGHKEMLARLALAHHSDVIVFDPLIMFNLGVDEKDNAVMGELGAAFSWLRHQSGTAVIVVHHTRKAPQVKSGFNPLSKDEARGAGVIMDLADAAFGTLEKDGTFYLAFSKRRWGAKLPTLKLALDPASLRFEVEGEEEPPFGGPTALSEDDLRGRLEVCLVPGRWLSTTESYERFLAAHTENSSQKAPPNRSTIQRWLCKGEGMQLVVKRKTDGKCFWRLK